MKIMNKPFVTLLTLSALAFFISCSSDDPVKTRNAAVKQLYRQGKVKIALANSFDENKSKMWEGAVLAQEIINSQKICPVEMELLRFDDEGTQSSGMKKAYEIAENKDVCAVIGHGYSDITLNCSVIYQYYGMLHFNYISTVHALTDKNNPLVFSNMPSDNDFGLQIAKICEQNGYKRVLIYYLENTSGNSLSNAFELSCNNLGIEVVNRDSYDLTTSDKIMDQTFKRWKNNFLFDAIFLAGRMPGLKDIIFTLRENDINCPIVGADPFDDPLLTQSLPPSENGKIFAVSNFNPYSTNAGLNTFKSAFMEKYGTEPDQEALQVYDALFVLARSIAEAKSAVPQEVGEAIRKGSWDEAAGPYTFNENGSIKNRRLTTKVFNNGKFEEIE